jgi:PleD family two-component response regulator
MKETKKILFICRDEEITRTIQTSLSTLNIRVVVSKGHLQGLTILDTNKFDIILAPWIEKNLLII